MSIHDCICIRAALWVRADQGRETVRFFSCCSCPSWHDTQEVIKVAPRISPEYHNLDTKLSYSRIKKHVNSCAIKWHSFLCRFPQDRLACVTQKWKIVYFLKCHLPFRLQSHTTRCMQPWTLTELCGTADLQGSELPQGVSIFGHNYRACAGQNALWPQQVAQRASIFLLLLLFCDFCPRETHEHNSGWVQVYCFCPKDSASSQGRPEHALARAGDTDCGPLGPINADPARGDHGRVSSSSPMRLSSKVWAGFEQKGFYLR